MEELFRFMDFSSPWFQAFFIVSFVGGWVIGFWVIDNRRPQSFLEVWSLGFIVFVVGVLLSALLNPAFGYLIPAGTGIFLGQVARPLLASRC